MGEEIQYMSCQELTDSGGEDTKMAPSKSMEESDASMRQRLVESLSQSFPGSALSKALHAMDSDDDNKSDDPLSSSCFAELRLEKCEMGEDEELTSLSWLQDNDLLKNINAGEDAFEDSSDELQKENGDFKMENNMSPQTHPPNIPYNPQKHINSKPPYSFSCLIFMAIEDSPMKRLPVKDIYHWILSHFPYFQNAPTGWKNSVRHNLSLNKCFKKVDKDKGQQSIGKGSLWMIDPDYRPNLLQALRKTPYHPYHQLQMLATPQPTANYTLLPGTPRPLPLSARLNLNTPSPHLFPFLSRRLAQSKLDSETDIDVANTLVSLKTSPAWRNIDNRFKPLSALHNNGSTDYDRYRRSPSPPEFGSEHDRYRSLKRKFGHLKRPSSPIICTSSPSEDHTYSVSSQHMLPRSPGSSIDEEYEFGPDDDEDFSETDGEYEGSDEGESGAEEMNGVEEDCPSPAKRRLVICEDDDEEMKIAQGADALLNLAGIKTANIVPLRSISPLVVNKNVINNNNNNNHIKIEVNS